MCTLSTDYYCCVCAAAPGLVSAQQALDRFIEMRGAFGRVFQVVAEIVQTMAGSDVLPDHLVERGVKRGVVDRDFFLGGDETQFTSSKARSLSLIAGCREKSGDRYGIA